MPSQKRQVIRRINNTLSWVLIACLLLMMWDDYGWWLLALVPALAFFAWLLFDYVIMRWVERKSRL